jgi:hypothetical protein
MPKVAYWRSLKWMTACAQGEVNFSALVELAVAKREIGRAELLVVGV